MKSAACRHARRNALTLSPEHPLMEREVIALDRPLAFKRLRVLGVKPPLESVAG